MFDEQLVKGLKKKDSINETENERRIPTDNDDNGQVPNDTSGPSYLEKHIDFNDRPAFLQILSSYFTGKVLGYDLG